MNNSIKEIEKNLNEKLKKEGKLTLGDIYDEFGFERVPWADYTTVTHTYVPPEIQNLNLTDMKMDDLELLIKLANEEKQKRLDEFDARSREELLKWERFFRTGE